MENDWLVLITPIMFALPADLEADQGSSVIINTGSVTSDPMNMKTPLLYSRISGPKSMPYLKNEA
jgi:hypothetical protein